MTDEVEKDPLDAELEELGDELAKQCKAIRLKAARSGQVTIRLRAPIKIKGIERKEIILRRLNLNDILDMQCKVFRDEEGAKLPEDAHEAMMERWMIGRLAAAPPEEVGQCDAADWRLFAAALDGFHRGRRTSRPEPEEADAG